MIPQDYKMKTPVFDRKLLFHIIRFFIIPIMTDDIQEINNVKYKKPILYMDKSDQDRYCPQK